MWRPFTRPLPDLREPDIQALLEPPEEDRIQEGLLVEYKRDWSSNKIITRAAASFANTAGGTLLVGVEARKLFPIGMPGIEGNPGELEERVVQVIRAGVAPVPDFQPKGVRLANGRVCLIVEISEGRLPPYLLIGTGVILERTPTSSDPVPIHNRETLDRLFATGKRGRLWAKRRSQEILAEMSGEVPPLSGLFIWTVPCVEDGLGANTIVFRRSFGAVVKRLALDLSGQEPFQNRFAHAHPYYVEYETPEINKTSYRLRVEPSGVIRTWHSATGLSLGNVDDITAMALAAHRELLESHLGHRGYVMVGLFARILGGGLAGRRINVTLGPTSVDELQAPHFLGRIHREVSRAAGYGVWEPEEGLAEE